MFMSDKSGKLYFQNSTWDDAPHLDEATKKELLASIPAWQHEMRTRGLPVLGQGQVYPVSESSIMCDPIEIPAHWPKLCAVDIGVTHDTAAVWTALDPETDTIYVYDCYHSPDGVPSTHAMAINSRGKHIPVILPHDADNTERGSGRTVASYYQDAGVNVAYETFHNPMGPDGKKNIFVEPGIMQIQQRMKTGRIKVFRTCFRFFEEMRRYHRKDGKIVKKFDDTMDAARYSIMSTIAKRGLSDNAGAAGFNTAYDDNWDTFNPNY